jgi:hypothetical protein
MSILMTTGIFLNVLYAALASFPIKTDAKPLACCEAINGSSTNVQALKLYDDEQEKLCGSGCRAGNLIKSDRSHLIYSKAEIPSRDFKTIM